MCASMATHGNRVEPWRAKTARNLLFTPQMGLSQCHSGLVLFLPVLGVPVVGVVLAVLVGAAVANAQKRL